MAARHPPSTSHPCPQRPLGLRWRQLGYCSAAALWVPRTLVPPEGIGRGSSGSWPHEAQQPSSLPSPVHLRAEHSPSLGLCPWGSGQMLKPWEASTHPFPSGFSQMVPRPGALGFQPVSHNEQGGPSVSWSLCWAT